MAVSVRRIVSARYLIMFMRVRALEMEDGESLVKHYWRGQRGEGVIGRWWQIGKTVSYSTRLALSVTHIYTIVKEN